MGAIIWLFLGTPPIQAEQSADTSAGIDVTAYLKGDLSRFKSTDFDLAFKALKSADPDTALTQLQRLKSSPARVKRLDLILYLESLALIKRGSMTEALESLQHSLALKGSNSDALFLYAQLLTNPQRKLDALTQALWFNRFDSIPPALALSEQAKLLLQQGETKRAEDVARKAIAQSPSCIECRITVAQLLLQGGKKPEALEHLRQAKALEPDDSTVKTALARALLAGAKRSTDGASIEEATELSRGLYATQGAHNTGVAALYAQALIESGQPSKASEIVKTALKLNPADPTLGRLAQQIQVEQQSSNYGAAAASVAPAPK